MRTPAQIESLIARVDVVVTTRMHGLVLALKNGVPALVIDPIRGGAKVSRQAEVLGWPIVHTVDRLDARSLEESLDRCLTPEARAQALECSQRAAERIATVRPAFLAAFGTAGAAASSERVGSLHFPRPGRIRLALGLAATARGAVRRLVQGA